MRVLHLTESRQWSGGAAQLLELVSGLAAKGCEQTIACPADGDLSKRAQERGLKTVPFLPRQDYDVPVAWRLSRVINSLRPDVVHAHHSRAHAVGLIAKMFSSPRPAFFMTRRVSFPVGTNPFSRLKYANPLIDGYIAVADSVGDILVGAGADRVRVRTIYSGVSPEKFAPRQPDPAMLETLGGADGTPLIGLIANFGHWKGQDVFLKAAKELQDRGVKAIFILAGKATDSEELKTMAQSLGLQPERLRLLGFRTDVPDIVACLTLSVNAATQGEGLSGALRESLAMGVPVLASDVAGNKELARPGETGTLFKPGDHEELADKIQEALDKPEDTRRLAAAGRSWVLANLTTEKMVERTLAFYQERLSARA